MEIPRHWRLRRERTAFELGHKCGMCGGVFTQDRPVCPHCGLEFNSGRFIGETGAQFVDYLFRIMVAEAERALVQGDQAEQQQAEEMMAVAALGDVNAAIEILATMVEA